MSTLASLPGRWTILYAPAATLSGDGTGFSAEVAFETDYSNIIPFVTAIGGQATTITLPGGGTMTRLVPLQHPTFTVLWASSVKTEAVGTPSATSHLLQDLYSNVIVIVTFSSIPYGASGSATPYTTVTVHGGGVYTSIPNRKLKFSTGEVLGQDAGEFSGQVSYHVTLFQCPTLGDVALNALLSKVNSDTFLGWPAGYLRFDTYDSDYDTTVGGVQSFKKSLSITYQSYPWNQFYRSDGVLDTATDPAGNPVYQTAAFSPVLSS